ncbi:hypothetical protein B296_00025544 [Ensete ventricosum]|uniref:Uncharacterized protein n=1 Tax=Ensete ventricosum TaxID=4639 RepID=A0A427ASZ5_ENSVE|nr:hypothetical protein B296_00025544 [Ensete ventricosum]
MMHCLDTGVKYCTDGREQIEGERHKAEGINFITCLLTDPMVINLYVVLAGYYRPLDCGQQRCRIQLRHFHPWQRNCYNLHRAARVRRREVA